MLQVSFSVSSKEIFIFLSADKEWAWFVSVNAAMRTGGYEGFPGKGCSEDVGTVDGPSWWPYVAGS